MLQMVSDAARCGLVTVHRFAGKRNEVLGKTAVDQDRILSPRSFVAHSVFHAALFRAGGFAAASGPG